MDEYRKWGIIGLITMAAGMMVMFLADFLAANIGSPYTWQDIAATGIVLMFLGIWRYLAACVLNPTRNTHSNR